MKKIRCQLLGEPAIPTVSYDEETPPAAYPGTRKWVKVEHIKEYEFECFSDAHPETDHEFLVGDGVLIIPWDKFRLQGKELFLEDEVRWKESGQ